MPFRIEWTARLLIADTSGTAHDIPDIFFRLEKERSGVIPLKHLLNNRGPEKIGQKSGDCIPFSHACSRERGVVRTSLQSDQEMVEVAEFPSRFQTDAVFGGTFNPLSQSESVKQERKVHARLDRQIQRTPEPSIGLDQLGPILCGVPLELDHRDPMPVIEGYQSGGCFERLDGWADAFAKNANTP